MVNLLGPAARERRGSPTGAAAGHGFAGLPFGNTGMQYGLGRAQAGPDHAGQFVDLNAKVGGPDIDSDRQDARIGATRPRSRTPTAPA